MGGATANRLPMLPQPASGSGTAPAWGIRSRRVLASWYAGARGRAGLVEDRWRPSGGHAGAGRSRAAATSSPSSRTATAGWWPAAAGGGRAAGGGGAGVVSSCVHTTQAQAMAW